MLKRAANWGGKGAASVNLNTDMAGYRAKTMSWETIKCTIKLKLNW